MVARRFRYSWEEIAALDCDYIASWGAFNPGCIQTIDFDDDTLPRLVFKMAEDGQSFSVAYRWVDRDGRQTVDFTQSRVELVKRPCRFGGTRAYFICPCCARTTLRLAVLIEGLRCGPCGRVTWKSRRERPLQRLMRKADKLSAKLGCDSWRESVVERPPHMHVATFERLRGERAALVIEINREISRRLSRSRGGLLGQMVGAIVKMGV